jgi:hypothetical protein
MLSDFMTIGYPRALLLLLSAAIVSFAGVACQKVPLLAPSGSILTLTSGATVLPIGGTAQIAVQVIQPSGNPPHSGTHVTFTTTLGTVEPSDATTDANGRAAVTFKAGTASGIATITAISGGAGATNGGNVVKIAIGAAAVGKVVVSANPATLSGFGGTTVVTASVFDAMGNPLPSAPVTFTTSAGTLSPTLVTTDAAGNAQTSLTTTVQATVTATAGVSATTGGGGTTPPPTTTPGTGTPPTGGGSTSGQASGTVTIAVNPLPNVSISVVGAGTGTGGTFVAGGPITFNIIASPGQNSTAQIRNVTVEFGDGDRRDLGAVTTTGTTPLPVQHIYNGPGTFTARVIVTDNFGFQSSSATIVVVQAQPPLSVTINQQRTVAGSNTVFNLTATVVPSTAVPISFFWQYRNAATGAVLVSNTTTSGQDSQTFSNTPGGPIIASVTVTTTTGQTASGFATLVP